MNLTNYQYGRTGIGNRLTKKSGWFLSLFAIGVFLLLLAGACDKYTFEPPVVDPNQEISFSGDVLPIFENAGCADCHNGSVAPNMVEGKVYESLLDGYISADPENNPEASEIYTKLEGGHPSQPLSVFDLSVILQWIRQGAKNN